MTLILTFVAALIGASVVGAVFIVGRNSYRQWMQRSIEGQAEKVRGLLESSRRKEFENLDNLLFDLRRSFDIDVIGLQLQRALEEAGHEDQERQQRLTSAFTKLGLAERYRDRVRTASAWRDRAQAARVIGLLRDSDGVGALLEAMRDEREDSDVKLAAAEALSCLSDPVIIPLLCEELANVDEWSSPRLAALLVSFGDEAIDPLLKTLDGSASLNGRIWAAQVLGKLQARRATQPLINRLHDRSEQMRLSAASALGDIADFRAVRPLVDIILRDPTPAVRAQAASGLGKIGDPDAVPILVGALGDPEYWMRFRALEAIEVLQPKDTSAIESALDDANTEVRLRAALALERLGRLEQSFEALASDDEAIVEVARARLVAVGRAGLSERFIRHLTDASAATRANVCRILGVVGDPDHGAELAPCLNDDDKHVRLAAIDSIGMLGADGTGPALVELFTDHDPDVRGRAAEALRRFPAVQMDPMIPALRDQLGEESDGTRLCAVRVISVLPGSEIDELLVGALHDRFVEVRLEAVRALGDRRVAAAVEPLGDSLADAYGPLRVAAADALGAIGGERAIDLMLAQVKQADRDQRDAICRGIAAVGFHALGPVLDVLIGGTDVNARVSAAWTLGKTEDERATPLLAELLCDSDVEVRCSAAGALGKIPCALSVHSLTQAMDDPSPFVRAAVVNGIGRIGGEEDLPSLGDGLDDPDNYVRNRTAVAIGFIGREWAYAMLTQKGRRTVAKASMVLALGLTGVPDAIGAAVSLLHDEQVRADVLALLGKEEEPIQAKFIENVKLDVRGSNGVATLDPEALAAGIIDTLRNAQDPADRRRAVAALVNLHIDAASETLSAALRHDPDVEVRVRAAKALSRRLESPDARTALLAGVLDPESQVRVVAIEASGEFADIEDARPLFDCILAHEPQVVMAAEQALGQIYANNVPDLLDWIMGQRDAGVLASGLRVVERIGDNRALGLLRHLSRAGNIDVRLEAARALAALHDPEAVRLLLDGLSDPMERIRSTIVTALSTIVRNDVLDRLDRVRMDPSVMVRTALAASLSKMRSTRAIDLLEALVKDQHIDVRTLALVSLLDSPDVEGQRRFLSLWPELDDNIRRRVQSGTVYLADQLHEQLKTALDSVERETAVHVLALLGASANGERIASGLVDPSAEVRLAAISALSTLDADRVSDWLKKVIDDPVADVRSAARRLLIKSVD